MNCAKPSCWIINSSRECRVITARHFLVLLILPLAACGPAALKISPADAARLVADGKAVLVDCREPKEWAEAGVASPAVLLPKSDFDAEQEQWKKFLAQNQGNQILLYCRSGGRAVMVITVVSALILLFVVALAIATARRR